MKVSSDGSICETANTPNFGHALSGKRARCSGTDFFSEQQCRGLSGSPQTLALLRKLSQDGFRASAAKGRLSTLSKDALHQQEIADNFTDVVSERCAPVFAALAGLSTGLRDDCKYTFPVMKKALEKLTKSAMGVFCMLEELNATKESRSAENEKLCRQAAELRDVLAERTLKITQLEESVNTLKSSIKEKESGRTYVDSTSRPIEELAAQRRKVCAELQTECSVLELATSEMRTTLALMRSTHECSKNEKTKAHEQLQQKHEVVEKKTAALQQETTDLARAVATLMELKQKDESALCLLKAQADSQEFCLDLLVSRTAATEEYMRDTKERLASSEKLKHALAKEISSSILLMPEILVSIGTTQADLEEQARKLEVAERVHAESTREADAFKEKVISVRCSSDAAKARLAFVEAKVFSSVERAQEQRNQILMFAEEMQVSYEPSHSAMAVASTATKETTDRLTSLRLALCSTQKIEEKTKSKCAELEAECAAVLKDTEEARQELNTGDDTHKTSKRIQELNDLKTQTADEVEAMRKDLTVVTDLLAEREALKEKVSELDESDLRCLVEEQAKYAKQLAELGHPNSSMRKAIAEEELALCDETFRQQIRMMRAHQETEIHSLETQLVALQAEQLEEEKCMEELTKLSWGAEEGRHEKDQISTTSRMCPSARKKIHSRRLIGVSDAAGASLSTPHLHALREKLTMIGQGSSKTRIDTSEAFKNAKIFAAPEAVVRRADAELRSTKGQKTGRRSGGDNCFDIFGA